jgi:hypothetical protein
MQHLLKIKLIKIGSKSKGYLRFALRQFFLPRARRSQKSHRDREENFFCKPPPGGSLGEASSARPFRGSDTRVVDIIGVSALDASLSHFPFLLSLGLMKARKGISPGRGRKLREGKISKDGFERKKALQFGLQTLTYVLLKTDRRHPH